MLNFILSLAVSYFTLFTKNHTEYKIKPSLLSETLDVLRLSVFPLVSHNWSRANWPVKIQSTGLGDIDTRWNSLAEFSPLFQFLRSMDNAGLCRVRSSVLPFLRCACVTYVTGGPATRSTANGQRHESLGFHCFSIDHHRDFVSCSFCRPHPAKPPHSGPILIIGHARRWWNWSLWYRSIIFTLLLCPSLSSLAILCSLRYLLLRLFV